MGSVVEGCWSPARLGRGRGWSGVLRRELGRLVGGIGGGGR